MSLALLKLTEGALASLLPGTSKAVLQGLTDASLTALWAVFFGCGEPQRASIAAAAPGVPPPPLPTRGLLTMLARWMRPPTSVPARPQWSMCSKGSLQSPWLEPRAWTGPRRGRLLRPRRKVGAWRRGAWGAGATA